MGEAPLEAERDLNVATSSQRISTLLDEVEYTPLVSGGPELALLARQRPIRTGESQPRPE